MNRFLGIVFKEIGMSIRRPAMWISHILLFIFYGVTIFNPEMDGNTVLFPPDQLWQSAGYVLFYGNMFMVLLGGILAADRLQRDFKLGVRELQSSTPLKLSGYILAKYFGALIAALIPQFIWVVSLGIYGFVFLGTPIYFMTILLTAFLLMGVPAFAFVVAFSLACPLVMPVRVYQVLFTGYWFWGNYLAPGAFPTISNTLLVPCGKYVLQGFLGGFPTTYSHLPPSSITSTDAVLNLLILFACVLMVLLSLYGYLRRFEQRA